MDVLSALDELRSLNARKQKLSFEQVLSALKNNERTEERKRKVPEEMPSDDEDAIRTLFYQQRAKLQKTEEEGDSPKAEAKVGEREMREEVKEAPKATVKRKGGLFKTPVKIKVKKKEKR